MPQIMALAHSGITSVVSIGTSKGHQDKTPDAEQIFMRCSVVAQLSVKADFGV